MTATLEVPIELTPTMKATSTIELRGFMWLSDLFKERHWSNPAHFDVNAETTGEDLLDQLAIPAKRVNVIFVNGRVFNPATAIIRPGDRVALVPPGAPMPF